MQFIQSNRDIFPVETEITRETQEQSTSTCKSLKREFHSLQIITTFSQQFKNENSLNSLKTCRYFDEN